MKEQERTAKQRVFGNLRQALQELKPHITIVDNPDFLPFSTPIDRAIYYIEAAISWECKIRNEDATNAK